MQCSRSPKTSEHGEGFTTLEVAHLAGITKRQILHWKRQAGCHPSLPEVDPGPGCRWSLSDVIGMRMVRELLERGVSLQQVRQILPALRRFTTSRSNLVALPQTRLALLEDGQVVFALDSTTLLDLAPRTGSLLIGLFVDVRPAFEDVLRAMVRADMTREIEDLRAAGAWILPEAA